MELLMKGVRLVILMTCTCEIKCSRGYLERCEISVYKRCEISVHKAILTNHVRLVLMRIS